MSETKLRECPFCGSADVHLSTVRVVGDEAYRSVICGDCYAESRGCLYDSETIDLWNRRASPAPAPSDVETAEGWLNGNGYEHGTNARLIGMNPGVERLAAEFAAVRAEATEAERERCAKITESTKIMSLDERAAAIRGSK